MLFISCMIIQGLQAFVLRFQNALVFQVDHPAGLQTEKDLQRVLFPREQLFRCLILGWRVAVLLGQLDSGVGQFARVAKIAAQSRICILQLVF